MTLHFCEVEDCASTGIMRSFCKYVEYVKSYLRILDCLRKLLYNGRALIIADLCG